MSGVRVEVGWGVTVKSGIVIRVIVDGRRYSEKKRWEREKWLEEGDCKCEEMNLPEGRGQKRMGKSVNMYWRRCEEGRTV